MASDAADSEHGDGAPSRQITNEATERKMKGLTASKSADELADHHKRQLSAKRKIARLQRQLHEAALTETQENQTARARERATRVRELSTRLLMNKQATRMQFERDSQLAAKQLNDQTRESLRRITSERAAAARENANGIRSRVQPTKLKEPLSPYLKSPVPELGDNTLPRLELLALVRGRDAVRDVQQRKREVAVTMRKCEEELRQQCKDRVQREQEAKLRKARRLTEATRHAARRAIDEVLAHKKEEGQAVRDRNDQAELKRQLLRNAVKASDEEVVDLAVACNHRLKELVAEDHARTPWAPWFKFFKKVDVDSSGLIAFDEFVNLVRVELGLEQTGLDETTVRAVWVTIDQDSSGYISCGEFAQFMRRGRHVLTTGRPTRDELLEKRARAARAARVADKEQLFHGRSLGELEDVRPASDAQMRELSELCNGRIQALREMLPPSPTSGEAPSPEGAPAHTAFAHKPTAGGRWYSLYKLADTNSNGFISLSELRITLARDLSLQVPEARLRAVWKALDRDGDGLVTCGEFLQFMKLGAPRQRSQSVLDARRQLGQQQRALVEAERVALKRAKLEALEDDARAMQQRARQLELELAQRRKAGKGGAPP